MTTSLGFGITTTRDPAWDEATARLWAMTADERVAAMRAGKLPMRLLFHWANHAPDEVPLLGGEFEFIAMLEPGYADEEPSAVAATACERQA